MERLGEFDNKVIIEQYNEPENKNVIWKDPEADEFKEYENGSWIKSRKIGSPNGGGGNEPLIVKGTTNSNNVFIPDNDQPSLNDAFIAFRAGRQVFAQVAGPVVALYNLVTKFAIDGSEAYFNDPNGNLVIWLS